VGVATDEAGDLHVPVLDSGVTVTRKAGGKRQCLTSLAYLDKSLDSDGRYAFLTAEHMGAVADHKVEYPMSARRQVALYAIGVK